MLSEADGDGIFEIRAVEEVGMVGRDTVVVRGSLPVRDNVGRASGAKIDCIQFLVGEGKRF
jgi:hypothetical protein